MLQVKKDRVIISRKKWEELKKDEYYKELIDVLEDSIELEKAKNNTKHFTDFNGYDKKRRAKMNNV
jgi:hypothetical protein